MSANGNNTASNDSTFSYEDTSYTESDYESLSDKSINTKSRFTEENKTNIPSDTKKRVDTKSTIKDKDILNKVSIYNKQDPNISYPVDLTLTTVDNNNPDIYVKTDKPIQIQTPTDSFTTLYDEFQNTIYELGFEETIRMSNDFKTADIKIIVGTNNFTVSGSRDSESQSKSTTTTRHKFYHCREFNRPIKNVEMEVGKGVAKVYGEFADF